MIACLEQALSPFGEIRTRSWGDVVSVELAHSGKTVFSFQVAQRGGQLEPSLKAPWPAPLQLDSLLELVAAKMTALVERGAPRDFRDIFTLCQAGIVDPMGCWDLWRRRQRLSGGDFSAARGRMALLTHLARIELHRPLDHIKDAQDRAAAEKLRNWFQKEFVDGLVD